MIGVNVFPTVTVSFEAKIIWETKIYYILSQKGKQGYKPIAFPKETRKLVSESTDVLWNGRFGKISLQQSLPSINEAVKKYLVHLQCKNSNITDASCQTIWDSRLP